MFSSWGGSCCIKDTREFKPFITKDKAERAKVVAGERLGERGRGGAIKEFVSFCGFRIFLRLALGDISRLRDRLGRSWFSG